MLLTGQVVVMLQGKLADVGANFKEVLEVRTKNIKPRGREQKTLSPRYRRNRNPPSTQAGPIPLSITHQDDEHPNQGSKAASQIC